jgi:hypothetical protein
VGLPDAGASSLRPQAPALCRHARAGHRRRGHLPARPRQTGYYNPVAGGIAGTFLADNFLHRFGLIGSNIMAGMLALIGVLLTTDFLIFRLFGGAQRVMAHLIRGNVTMYESMRRGYGGWLTYLDRQREAREAEYDEEGYEEESAYADAEETPRRSCPRLRKARLEKLDKKAAAIAARAARRSNDPVRISTGDAPFPPARGLQEDLPLDELPEADEVDEEEVYEDIDEEEAETPDRCWSRGRRARPSTGRSHQGPPA